MDGDGVCFYPETGYRGKGYCVRAGQDVRELPNEWAGAFQSVKFFGRATAVVVFAEPDYGGRRSRILRDQPDLNRLRIASIRVY